MTARSHSIAGYAVILVLLLLLTAATVGVSFLNLDTRWHAAAGWGIGAIKATLVVLFFMHLADSPPLAHSVIAVTLLFLLILFGLTACDYLSRGELPYAPGH